MSGESQPPKESLKDRMKKLALWKWGLMTIVWSIVWFVIMAAGRPTRRLTTQQKVN